MSKFVQGCISNELFLKLTMHCTESEKTKGEVVTEAIEQFLNKPKLSKEKHDEREHREQACR